MTTSADAVKVKIETITPQKAEEYLGKNIKNRSIKEQKVEQYARALKAGDWKLNGEAIKFDDKGELRDGQHRLVAILESGKEMTTFVVRGVSADSQETMDQGASRSINDTFKLRGESNWTSLSVAVGMIWAYEQTGIPYIMSRRPSVQEACRTLDKNREIMNSYPTAGKFVKRTWIPYTAVVALHYLFSSASGSDADFFFDNLASGAGLELGSPIRKLREMLINDMVKSKQLREISAKQKIALIIVAWNLFMTGDTIKGVQWRGGGRNPEPFPSIYGLSNRNKKVSKSS